LGRKHRIALSTEACQRPAKPVHQGTEAGPAALAHGVTRRRSPHRQRACGATRRAHRAESACAVAQWCGHRRLTGVRGGAGRQHEHQRRTRRSTLHGRSPFVGTQRRRGGWCCLRNGDETTLQLTVATTWPVGHPTQRRGLGHTLFVLGGGGFSSVRAGSSLAVSDEGRLSCSFSCEKGSRGW
jgi:hypothetical protein